PVRLLEASGLKIEMQNEINSNAAFARSWKNVRAWSEQARYQLGRPESVVRSFYSAVVGKDGVLLWLKKYW
ncbi:MAG: hypothetical protein ACREEM_44010, partial [Blastocatellia bacterium]